MSRPWLMVVYPDGNPERVTELATDEGALAVRDALMDGHDRGRETFLVLDRDDPERGWLEWPIGEAA